MLTVKEIAEMTGRSYASVDVILGRKNIAPAERHGRLKLYDESAAEIVGRMEPRAPRLTDEQRKERHREAVRKWDRKKGRSRLWKVSLLNAYGWWCVRACSLSRADTLGITARAKPHAYGIRNQARKGLK